MSERIARRVLIVEDETLVRLGLAKQLREIGHTVVGEASNVAEARQMFREQKPDVVLLDIRLGDEDGIQVGQELLQERRVPMLIVTAHSEPDTVARAAEAGVFGYLLKEPSNEAMAAQIEVAVQRFIDYETLARKNEELIANLENRKLIERAKGILMKRANLDEPAAPRRLQTESQKRRINIVELAKKIIETDSVLEG
jgi:AmiR/NasT family two-component response regulator